MASPEINSLRILSEKFKKQPCESEEEKKQRLTQLSSALKKFNQKDNIIQNYLTEKKIEGDERNRLNNISADYKKLYCKVRAEIKNQEIKIVKKDIQAELSEDSTKLNFPKFSGNRSDWPEFRKKFLDVCKSKSDLNFSFVLDAVEKDLFDKNVRKAIDVKNFLANKFLEKLLTQSPMKSNSQENINKFLKKNLMYVAALKLLNDDASHWDVVIVGALKQKLDEDTKIQWEKKISKDELPTLSKFFKFLNVKQKLENFSFLIKKLEQIL